MRALGVDWGTKRIGLAVGESQFGISRALSPVAASGNLLQDAEALIAFARGENCEVIVIGLPLQEDGSPGEVAKICLQLEERIKELRFPVETVNEAMTSLAAEADLVHSGYKAAGRKKRRDSAAAQIILDRFFSEQQKA